MPPADFYLEHDPRAETGFPSGQTRCVCPESMLKQKEDHDPIQSDRIMICRAFVQFVISLASKHS
jgi:hypothetical protein